MHPVAQRSTTYMKRDIHNTTNSCILIFFLLFLFSESTFHIVAGPRSEQSEPILQGVPLYGPVGTHHQPARTMNLEPQQPVKGLQVAQDEWCEP